MSDATITLSVAPWLALKPREVGVRVFDVVHDILVAEHAAATAPNPADGDRTGKEFAKLKSA